MTPFCLFIPKLKLKFVAGKKMSPSYCGFVKCVCNDSKNTKIAITAT